jgi:hypothetical protein
MYETEVFKVSTVVQYDTAFLPTMKVRFPSIVSHPPNCVVLYDQRHTDVLVPITVFTKETENLLNNYKNLFRR